MKLETIKKDRRKNILIVVLIVLSVVSVVTLTMTRAKYRSVQSLKLASGTVKYNGYDFKIIAMKQSEDGINYTEIETMPESGYIINEEKSYCTTDNKTQVNGKLKTENGKHYFLGLNKNDKCYIWFDKIKITNSSDIIKYSYINNKSPDFTKVATTDEGIYQTSDSIYGGTTYYWRGTAPTNHIIYSGKCWRIVRINGDESIRLIYNGTPSGTTCPGNGENANSVVLSGTAYNPSYNNSSYVGWTYSVGSQRPPNSNPQTSGDSAPIKTALENWYSTNITDKSKVVAGKFCNDRNTMNNESWRATGDTQLYAAVQRLMGGNKIPTLSCPNGDVYELSVGMITADEVQFAGASAETPNTSYYLYNGQSYWTMTPYRWFVHGYAYMSLVYNNGGLCGDDVNRTWHSVRPVINLNSNVTFNEGSDGTQNNPYIVQ